MYSTYYSYVVGKPRVWIPLGNDSFISDRCAFRTVEGFLSALSISCLMECSNMYFICYTAVLLKTTCCIVAADAHRNGVRLGVQWLSLLLQYSECCSLPATTRPLLVIYVHCDFPAAPGATVLRYRWLNACFLGELSFCPQFLGLELSSQLSVTCSSVPKTL